MDPEESREAFRGRRFRVEVERWPEGRYEVARSPSASAVVATTPGGDVILVRHVRRAVRDTLLELPAGLVDRDEDPEACAVRELSEETGYRATRMEPLGWFYSSAGFTDERFELFLATAEPEPVGRPDDEVEELVRMPLEKAAAAVLAGRIPDAKTALGLLLARERTSRRH